MATFCSDNTVEVK